MEPVSIKTAAPIFGVDEATLKAKIASGEIPRYGGGIGKVRLSDVFKALRPDACPTCKTAGFDWDALDNKGE